MRTDSAHDPVRQDLAAIRGYVSSLVARERLILVVRAGIRLLVAFGASGVAGVFLPVAGVAYIPALFALVTGTGVAVWWALVPILAEALASRRDALRPARLVESRAPALRGMLLTAVDQASRPAEVAKPNPLVAAITARALAGVRPWPPSRVHPVTPLVPRGLALALGWLLLVGGVGLSPLGASGTLRWWIRAIASDRALAALVPDALRPEARVGDLVLRYTYPSYTGLEPKEIPNSTGDVSAPPGTEVEVVARSGQVLEAAGLLVYGDPLEAALAEGGRVVSGRFQVRTEPGEWRVVTWRSGQSLESRAFEIVPDPDLAPDVTVDLEGARIEVSSDQPLSLPWRARDDFGVRSAVVEIDGKEVGKPLFRAEGRRAEVGEVLALRPADLGLRAGDRVRLVVAAWDNDTVSGSKVGRSRSIEVVVLGAQGRAELAARRQEELMRLLLPVLAHFLVEEFPPGPTGGRLADWGEAVAGRYRPLSEAVERMWAVSRVPESERGLVGAVLSSGTDLIRYTQIGFEPGSAAVVPQGALATTAALRDEAILSLEDAIAFLDRLEKNRALRVAVEAALALTEAAERLNEAVAAGDPQRLLSALDAQREATSRLSDAAKNIPEGPLRDTIEHRSGEISAVDEEIQKRLEGGRPEDAAALTQRMAGMMRDLSAAVQGEIERMQSQAQDAGDAAAALREALSGLEEEQRALQEEVEALRNQQDAATAERMAKAWAELERRAAELGAHGSAVADGLEAADRAFFEQERARAARDGARALGEAIAARDVRGGLQEAERSEALWQTLSILASRGPRAGGPGQSEMTNGLNQSIAITSLLEQLDRAASLDPSLAALQEAQSRQRDLSGRLDEAQRKGEELAKDFPVPLRNMQSELGEAGERMGKAGEELGEGRAMQAEGEQSVAADRVGAARRALEQAMAQAQQQSAQLGQQGQAESGEGEEGEEGDKSGSSSKPEDQVEIPAPEEFRTPEEYRGALLEGMEGDVPEEYRALKKRYYEELVAQ